jgi:hypothetical protein
VSRVGVRSEVLSAGADAVDRAADEVRAAAVGLVAAAARCRPPPVLGLLHGWALLQGRVGAAAGPGGLAGEALALEACAVRLRLAARAYEGVEAGVAAVMAAVAAGADLAARRGWLDEGATAAEVRVVAPRVPRPAGSTAGFAGVGDVVAAGEGLDGGRVRVVEVGTPVGGSAWVVIAPGTQRWSPVPGTNPFDLTTDVRSVAGGGAGLTVAAAGVAAALGRAQAASPRWRPDDPVLLAGHSQGGILAAALAGDPGFGRRHRVTHVLTTGAPVGAFPVPEEVRVLSVEHVADPVPALDLTPNPARESWSTLRAGTGPPVDLRRHSLDAYVATTRAAADAQTGSVTGVSAWRASAGAFLGRPVLSVTEVVVTRGQGPEP